MKLIVLTAVLFLFQINLNAQKYKNMMHDYSINFYDVVKEAEAYFKSHPTGKGSGYKGYLRWKYENEGKFYPSGDRSKVSPYLVQNAWVSQVLNSNKGGERSSQNSWIDLGPYSADSVTSHYSEGIGRVETFFVDHKNTDKIYLGSRSGGFWRTTDGGNTWLCTTDTLTSTGVNSLSASVSNSDSLVISLRNANNGYSQGLYTSINGGLMWQKSAIQPSSLGWGGLGKTGRINTVVVSPFNSKIVFIGTDRGLYTSNDFVTTYNRPLTSGNISQIVFHPTNDSIVYLYNRSASNRNEILISKDLGRTFATSGLLSGNNNNTNIRLSVSKSCADCIYVASNNGVWKSVNQGNTFTFLSNPSQSCGAFTVSDTDTSKLVYGYVDLTASDDGGQNFVQKTWWSTGNGNHTGSSYIHADMRCAGSLNGVFYVGTDGYLCKSKDGGVSWEIISKGTGIREFYRFGISQSEQYVSMAGSQDNGTSIHKKQGWIEWNGGDGMEAFVHPLNPDYMVGSWQFGNRNRTLDGGLTRRRVDHSDQSDWIAPMFFDPNHQMHVYSVSNKIYKSDTLGNSWYELGQINSNIKHAAIAENNSNILVVVRNKELRISFDGGNTLQDLSNKLPNSRSISDITFDPLNDSTLLITYDSYRDDNRRIYISKDLGQTWKNISFNLSNMPLRCVTIDHSDSHNIIVGGEIGVYYMPMGGNKWNLYSKDLPNVSVRELEVQWATNTLRAVTWGRGMWETKLPNRENFPEITQITPNQVPTFSQPVEDLPISITAQIKSVGGVNEVYVLWSKDTANFVNRINMKSTGGNGYKTETPIPNFPDGTEMYFKVFAKNSTGDLTESYKFNYQYKKCNTRPRNVTANASKTQIILGDSIQLTGSGAQTYEWNNGVENGVYFKPQTTTMYQLTGRNAEGCAGYDSILVEVEIKIPDGLEENQFGENFSVFPNPAKDNITVYFGRELNEATLRMYNANGQEVYLKKISNLNSMRLNMGSFESGNYLLKVSVGNNEKVFNVIKK